MESSMKFWVLTALILIAIVPFALRADMTKKLLFSNKGYAKQIEVKTYILTQEQVAKLFKEPDKAQMQLTVDELHSIKNIYFIIRIKNLGKSHAWGILSCKVPGIYAPLKISIPTINKSFCDYVICISGFFVSYNESSPYPIISYEWSELYTK